MWYHFGGCLCIMWNPWVVYLFEALFKHILEVNEESSANIKQGSQVTGSEFNLQLSKKKKVVLIRHPQHPWWNLFLLGNSVPHHIVYQLGDYLFVPWFPKLFMNTSARIYVIHTLCHVTHFYMSVQQTAFCCTKL